ncbi:hypothetical protein BDV12DRAFT_3106 [Aspergillus spectabilis]
MRRSLMDMGLDCFLFLSFFFSSFFLPLSFQYTYPTFPGLFSLLVLLLIWRYRLDLLSWACVVTLFYIRALSCSKLSYHISQLPCPCMISLSRAMLCCFFFLSLFLFFSRVIIILGAFKCVLGTQSG